MKLSSNLVRLRPIKLAVITDNWKQIAQFILAAFMVAVGIWFFKHQEAELGEIRTTIVGSKTQYIALGIFLSFIYIYLQGLMYQISFRCMNQRVSIFSSIILFLKRNFISVFIPAGGITSLAFFTSEIEKQGVPKTKIHFSSTIYGFIGILSVVLVAIPVFIFALTQGMGNGNAWLVLLITVAVLFSLWGIYKSIINKGVFRRLLIRYLPSAEVIVEELAADQINKNYLLLTVLVSVLIDITGICHLYIAMLALGLPLSVFAAAMVYLTAVLFLIVSPFMRGLGAIEVSMTYVLTQFGYSSIEAISLTFLYRFFEFWLPLIIGAFSFLYRFNKIFNRIIPPLLLMALGIINILSALTPAIASRLELIENYLPLNAILASNYIVLLAGIFLLLTATFMIKGLKSAWWIALFLSVVSFIANLTKAIDYEEAIVAALVISMLLYSKKEYKVRSNPSLRYVGLWTAVISILAVFMYGTVGFYYLDVKHLNIDFSIQQSIRYTFLHFFQIRTPELIPQDGFTEGFLLSINVSGILSLCLLFYTLAWPYVVKRLINKEQIEQAKTLVERFGNSGLDYFKTYQDKLIFKPQELDAFISYKIANNFAVVLENPVAVNDADRKQCIRQFDLFCRENGLKSIYFRVPEVSLPVYRELKKKHLFVGQECVVDLDIFTISGTDKKALRNALNKVVDRGFCASIHVPPIKDGLIQKLKAVSDDWLKACDRKEIVFSQGVFDEQELKSHTIITVESAEEKIVGFLNIIPDYAPEESTYDLIRKTSDAPNGVVDFLLVEMFKYEKLQGKRYVNLGFAPLSGIDSPQNMTEKSMKFAYQKIRSFAHYKGLRDYKEKFNPKWSNIYMIYDHDFELLQAPLALTKVIKF